MRKKSPSQHMSRNQCLLRYRWRLCDLYSRCCVWFPCVSTQFWALHYREVCNLSKTPGFTWISQQAFFTHCRNTSKSLTGTEYTEAFRWPHIKKFRGLRSGDHIGQLIGPLLTRILIQVLSNNAGKMRWCPITHEEEAHVPRVLVTHLPKKQC
jgi:hypothetical protein